MATATWQSALKISARLALRAAAFGCSSGVGLAAVLALYGRDIAAGHSRPKETAQRIKALLGFMIARHLLTSTATSAEHM